MVIYVSLYLFYFCLDKFQQYRHAVKSIRDREEKLSDAREKKRSLQSRILNLSKTSPKSPKLAEFQKELKSLARDTHESELDLADFKRFALKEAFYLRFNAMNEYAEKTALIAGFGKYMTDLIDIEPTPSAQQNRSPYEKGPQAAIIYADAINAVNSWKPIAEDERPTLANAVIEGKGKGKETAAENEAVTPEETAADKNPPPELPPRRPTMDSINIAPVQTQPTGYTSDEIANVTGDLKTAQENEIDLDKIDLYDAPPPAYDGPPPSSNQPQHISSPLNSDHLVPQEHYSFSSPYQSNATLPPAPQPQHQYQLYDSPATMHQQLQSSPYPQHQQHYQHQDSSFYDATSMMYNTQVNYQQLYRQVSQRRQPAAYRPYSEFQQQFNHTNNNNNNNARQRVDAGGFRIPAPAPTHDSAEDEKEKLAQYYRQQEQQEQQYSFEGLQYEGSHYGGGSQYGGSQYGGSQYGGSQYGGLAGNHQPQQTPQQQPQLLHPQGSVKSNTSPQIQPATAIDPQELHKPNYEQKIQEEE